MDERIYALREEAKKEGNPVLREKSFELLIKKVKEKQPESVLEIGVNVGLTGTALLLTAKNARLTGIEIDEEKIKTAKRNYALFGVENRTKIFAGDASEIIPMLTGEYDFIFLDGPKGQYHRYLKDLLGVLKRGGILFADNVGFRGYVGEKVKTPHRFMTAKRSIEEFLKDLTENKGLRTEIIDIEDGVSITEKL